MGSSNSIETLILFLRCLKVNISRTTICKELDSHPENPSLLAISDVLNYCQVPNSVYQADLPDLYTLHPPFIVSLCDKYTEFAVVKYIDKNRVVLSNERWHNQTLSIEEFNNVYTGIILLAEPNQHAGEPNYQKKKRSEILNTLRFPFVFLMSFILLMAALALHSEYLLTFNIAIGLLTFYKVSGVVVTVLLLVRSINVDNPIVQRICNVSNNSGCNEILSSKAAKITDELSWSEVGFFYFSGSWLALLFNSDSLSLIQLLAILNILSLPYTIYSFFYQAYIERKICIFCCAVQILLWLEFLSFFQYVRQPIIAPNIKELSALIISMAIPVLIWITIKPGLLKLQKSKIIKAQLEAFKYSSKNFQKLLISQPNMQPPDESYSLVTGSKEPGHIITMISNPYCQPCSYVHQTLHALLTIRDDLQLRIVFSMEDHEQDKRREVANHIMMLNFMDKNLAIKALNEWYNQKTKSYKTWALGYPIKMPDSTMQEVLKKQVEWCQMTNVNATPTIFIDGYKMPDLYQIQDIKYLI